eukprot:1370732-Amphidinium_carterae.1
MERSSAPRLHGRERNTGVRNQGICSRPELHSRCHQSQTKHNPKESKTKEFAQNRKSEDEQKIIEDSKS